MMHRLRATLVYIKIVLVGRSPLTMDIERRLDIFCVIENVTFPVGNL